MNTIINTHFCEIAKVANVKTLNIHERINVREFLKRDHNFYDTHLEPQKTRLTRNERGAYKMIDTFINRYKNQRIA